MTAWNRRESPLVVAHRGVRRVGSEADEPSSAPLENTLEAFECAREAGASAIELDVQASLDGEAIVVHDPDLSRITGGRDPRRIGDLEWAELRAVSLPEDVRLVRLGDVLEWASAANVAVNVEVKRDGRNRLQLIRRVAAVVRASKADVLLSSFDPLLLSAVGALAPRVPRAWLVHPQESPPFWLMAAAARRPVVQAMHPRHDQLTAERVDVLHGQGLWVGAYTVNDSLEAARLCRLGVDWLITDRPSAMERWIRPPDGAP